MKIGILSDSHDHVAHLIRAVSLFRQEEVQQIFHAGDFCSPFTIPIFKGFEMDAVFGNNDGDHFRLVQQCREHNIRIHNEFFETKIDSLSIALYHGTQPSLTRALVECGRYDLVITGHTHQAVHKRMNQTLWLNPGSAHGFDGEAGVVVFDTGSKNVKWLTLGE